MTPTPIVRPLDTMPSALAVGFDPETRVITILRSLWETHQHLRGVLFDVRAPMTVDQFAAFDRAWHRERSGR